MHSSSFRMVPNTKQRIFVVKSNLNSRLIPNVGPPKHRDVYEANSEFHRKRLDSNDAATNTEIERLMSLPSNLLQKNTDSADQQVIKSITSNLVQKVVEQDQLNSWHKNILSTLHGNQPQPGPNERRFCTYRPIEDRLQSHADRLRAEINKRRHRIETECANDLGLTSPWRRARYKKAPKFEEETHGGLINPSNISLNMDGQPQSNMGFDQQYSSQPTNSYYNNDSQNYINQQSFNDSIQQYDSFNDSQNQSMNRSPKRSNKPIEKCPVCDRECRKQLFCLCCDDCGRRFHGKCVKMTEKRLTKRQGQWRCNDCVKAPPIPQEPKEDLFCVCKKPYDSRQFYVGCDSCEGWFHPQCVGTSQQEVESIEGASYICPNCRHNTRR